jgi:hypothetical protein
MDLSHKWGVKFGHQCRSSEAVRADSDAWSAHGDNASEVARIQWMERKDVIRKNRGEG